MEYLLSIQDPIQAEKIISYLNSQENVSLKKIPVYENQFAENEQDSISFLSRLYFLSPENQAKIFEFMEKLLEHEIQEQTQLFEETAQEDIDLANVDLENYSNELKIIDSE